MSTKVRLFDISSPDEFFRVICRAAKLLRSAQAKETERLLFIIFGLNHLREWIAPDYKAGLPETSEEHFFEAIYKLDSFKLLNAICNHTKHLRPFSGCVETKYGLKISEWPDIDSVASFDDGPPSGYSVDGCDVLDAIDEVTRFYDEEWFSMPARATSK
ncbi:MAG: hypothetical protein A2Z95_08955 [Gallionellales bacterium GWA2_60_18]|nr:MAG: hypothetical protein A2Z95_08955 [Gallionellales bacterium GWA2_60_18]